MLNDEGTSPEDGPPEGGNSPEEGVGEDGVGESEENPHGTGPEVPPEKRSTGSTLWGWGKELLIIVALGLIVSTLLRTFVFQMFEIPSQSMENTLLVGDRVAVQKVTDFDRGDVVVFKDPGGWLPPVYAERGPVKKALEFIGILPNSSDQYLIKRVIGMPGDVVICCDVEGRIMVNGEPIDESAYLYADSAGMVNPSDIVFEVTVPAGRIFVLGDHRNASGDSRCHLSDLSTSGVRGDIAFVPVENVEGVAFAVTFPFSRFHLMHRATAFDHVPDPEGPAPERPSISPPDVVC